MNDAKTLDLVNSYIPDVFIGLVSSPHTHTHIRINFILFVTYTVILPLLAVIYTSHIWLIEYDRCAVAVTLFS